MNKILISILFIISLVGCAIAVDGSGVGMRPGEAMAEKLFDIGIGQPWVGGNPPSDSLYSQYYWSYKGSAPKKHIESPKKHLILDSTPSTVYFSYQMQAVPYTQYQSNAAYTGGNTLWIQGSTSWSQYAKVPQWSGLSLLATSSPGGNGYLYEITPDGKLSKESFYFFPGSSQIDFYACTALHYRRPGKQCHSHRCYRLLSAIISADNSQLSAYSDNSTRDNNSASNRRHTSDDCLPRDGRISGIPGWQLHRHGGDGRRRT
jgi:hypothetical protein